MLNPKRIITTVAIAACLTPAATASAGQTDLRSPDTRDAAQAAAVARNVDLRSPDSRDAGRTVVPVVEPVQVVERHAGGGFQWGDAGIGAAGMLALVLLVASAGMAVGQRRRLGRSTTANV